ncbi:hypothetical protein KGF54_002602 [Candida jiufengensis]|uniref:uncharacterized protein n=1 Tax=Candida jiufengensis TaxID=497108 RepID=UPI002225053E|nr:uncharacterized protein KGF54_002602 [Candida jiufengensis]KAI5953231.1 hypothetical protein KGF54_002602 [Candida jiufengensis]
MVSVAPDRNSSLSSSLSTTTPIPSTVSSSRSNLNNLRKKSSHSSISNKQLKNSQETSSRNKLIIRLLPPSLTKENFLNQLATVYPYHASKIQKFYYIKGIYPSNSFEVPNYSRAYIDFNNVGDVEEFLKFLNGVSFEDEKDSLIPVIEKCLFCKMIDCRKNLGKENQTNTKVQSNTNTKSDFKLENDEIYKKFLSFLSNHISEFDLLKVNRSINKKLKTETKKDDTTSATATKKKKPRKRKNKKEEATTEGSKVEKKDTKKENKKKENPKKNKPKKTDEVKDKPVNVKTRDKENKVETKQSKPKKTNPTNPSSPNSDESTNTHPKKNRHRKKQQNSNPNTVENNSSSNVSKPQQKQSTTDPKTKPFKILKNNQSSNNSNEN